MKIDDQTIDNVAHLARLHVAAEDREGLKRDMNRILEFMDKLNEVDTEQVEPLIYMTTETSLLRDDTVKQEITTAQALQNAPAQDGKYFRVAKVIDKS